MLENLLTNKFSNLNPVQSDWIIRAFYCLETVLLRQKGLMTPQPYSDWRADRLTMKQTVKPPGNDSVTLFKLLSLEIKR